MSTHAPALPAVPTEYARRVRWAKALSWLSIGWMAIEASVAVVAALVAGSVALLGFGLDSLIRAGVSEHHHLALHRSAQSKRYGRASRGSR